MSDDVDQVEPIEEPADLVAIVPQGPIETPIFVQPAPRERRALVGHDSSGRAIWIECESEEAAAGWDDRIWHR